MRGLGPLEQEQVVSGSQADSEAASAMRVAEDQICNETR